MNKTSFFRIIFAVVFSALAVSCGGSGDDPVIPSVVKVDSHLFKADVAGGTVSVPYSIEGYAAASLVEVSSEAAWISVSEVTLDKVTLKVEPNSDKSDRTGRVLLSAENAHLWLHILQSKESDAKPIFNRFKIQVSDIKTSSVKVEVTPVDPSALYYCTIVNQSDLKQYGSYEKIAALLLDNLSYMASMIPDGADPNTLLYLGYFNSAEDANTSMDLNDNSEYAVIAFNVHFDETGTVVYDGGLEYCKFRTRQATQVDMTFSLSMSGTTLTVTPSADYTYICGVTSKAAWDECEDHADIARQYVSIAKKYGMLDELVLTGRQTSDFSDIIETSGTYVAYAFGYRKSSSDSGVTTEVAHIEFNYTK